MLKPLFADFPPDEQLSASVIIPAKNQAQQLTRSLDALRLQLDLKGAPLSPEKYEVLILVNNSRDNTIAIARSYARSHPWMRLRLIEREFDPEQAHIGHIRRLLMDEAALRLRSVGRSNGLVLSTDADTEVEAHWIAQNRREVELGAEAVGGRILLRPSELGQLDERTREIQLLDEQYGLLLARLEDYCDPQPYDRWPRHHQHFGGSLAIIASVYEGVGGLPPEKILEDVAFYRLLMRRDVRFRHSPDVRVRTSPRLNGRTRIGLAEQLTRWSEYGMSAAELRVPSVSSHRRYYQLRARFRRLWRGKTLDVSSFAAAARVSEDRVGAALQASTFGAAFEELCPPEAGAASEQSLRSAVDGLQREFAHGVKPGSIAIFAESQKR